MMSVNSVSIINRINLPRLLQVPTDDKHNTA